MTCIHKFFSHPQHLNGVSGLLPSWEVNTLIIGTFNPENKWHANNRAKYYYGRNKNLFWDVLPRFAGVDYIGKQNIETQTEFLKKHKIGVTDLLVSIDDADITDMEHVRRITTVLDKDIELFNCFTWNTDAIFQFIKDQGVEAAYFTKLGI